MSWAIKNYKIMPQGYLNDAPKMQTVQHNILVKSLNYVENYVANVIDPELSSKPYSQRICIYPLTITTANFFKKGKLNICFSRTNCW